MDHLQLNSSNFKDELTTKFKTYTVLFVIPVVLLLSVFSLRQYFTAQEDYNQLEQEVAVLKGTVDTFNQNKKVVSNEIDKHNQLLLSIIPEKEDYFSIIVALEKLSQQTGFLITQYTIDILNTNSEKLSLSVEGQGDTETFLKFLQQYQYDGGRLITNEKMEFGNNNSGSTKLTLNFYHKSLGGGEEKVESITKNEVDFIENIASKVNLSYAQPEDESGIEYETKTNPF